MEEPFYSFNMFLRQRFGCRVHKISLDAGFSCPNLDGKIDSRGCIFCNNKAFSHFSQNNKINLREQIASSITFYKKRFKVNKFIAYFQAFTNTYADLESLRKCYDVIRDFSEIVGLSISTRPDCVDEEKIKLISTYKKDYLVCLEYGLQTTNNRILKEINRQHTYEDFLTALDLTRKYAIDTAVHLILGLPTAGYEDIIADAERIAKLDIQGIKFHVLHVLKDTQLYRSYKENRVKLLAEEEYVKIICDFLERIPPNIVILRLISDAASDHLVAPLWANSKQRVLNNIRKELVRRKTYQGYYYERNFNPGKQSKVNS